MDIPADAIRETWESVFEASVRLAQFIEKHCRETGEQFDAIVVVPRGSYYPVNIVARELGFSAVDLLHACISSYELTGTARKIEFTLGQMPLPEQVAGKNLLIIEEVCDTGYTLEYLCKWLAEQGANLIRSGVLHYKPTLSKTGFKPDWVVTETDTWVAYPWEVHEANGKQSQVRRQSD